jgi:hypothetical protein
MIIEGDLWLPLCSGRKLGWLSIIFEFSLSRSHWIQLSTLYFLSITCVYLLEWVSERVEKYLLEQDNGRWRYLKTHRRVECEKRARMMRIKKEDGSRTLCRGGTEHEKIQQLVSIYFVFFQHSICRTWMDLTLSRLDWWWQWWR